MTIDRDAGVVAVIGAGLGGLAAACTLGARGYRVALYERNGWFGGKAAQLSREGFRFDMGPTILTVPTVLRRIFAEAGRDMNEYLELVRLDPQWKCFFDDGSVLELKESVSQMCEALRAFTTEGGSSAGYRRFINYSRELHEISERFFFWRSVGGLRDMFDARSALNLATLRDVLRLKMGRSVAGVIRKHTPDARVAQMLDHFTQYVGSSPFGSPAVLCAIAHMQTAEGVWYPMGGTRAVPESLARLAGELGVEMYAGVGVERIIVRNGRAESIRLSDGSTRHVAAVVSNMDAVRTHRELLPEHIAEPFLRRRTYEPACSGVVLYLGLRKAYDHLAHHSFVFSRDAHEEFDWIYRKGEPAPDPTVYLAAPARTEPCVAPPGGEALYALVHTPYLRDHHDWSRGGALYEGYRRTILDKLRRCAGMTDIDKRIVFEESLTPRDIHERYGVLRGAIYGLASHGTVLGAFKPGNRSPDVRGLYLAGGAAHPGPGMPMVMMSGWIAADALDHDAAAPRRIAAGQVLKATP